MLNGAPDRLDIVAGAIVEMLTPRLNMQGSCDPDLAAKVRGVLARHLPEHDRGDGRDITDELRELAERVHTDGRSLSPGWMSGVATRALLTITDLRETVP